MVRLSPAYATRAQYVPLPMRLAVADRTYLTRLRLTARIIVRLRLI